MGRKPGEKPPKKPSTGAALAYLERNPHPSGDTPASGVEFIAENWGWGAVAQFPLVGISLGRYVFLKVGAPP